MEESMPSSVLAPAALPSSAVSTPTAVNSELVASHLAPCDGPNSHRASASLQGHTMQRSNAGPSLTPSRLRSQLAVPGEPSIGLSTEGVPQTEGVLFSVQHQQTGGWYQSQTPVGAPPQLAGMYNHAAVSDNVVWGSQQSTSPSTGQPWSQGVHHNMHTLHNGSQAVGPDPAAATHPQQQAYTWQQQQQMESPTWQQQQWQQQRQGWRYNRPVSDHNHSSRGRSHSPRSRRWQQQQQARSQPHRNSAGHHHSPQPSWHQLLQQGGQQQLEVPGHNSPWQALPDSAAVLPNDPQHFRQLQDSATVADPWRAPGAAAAAAVPPPPPPPAHWQLRQQLQQQSPLQQQQGWANGAGSSSSWGGLAASAAPASAADGPQNAIAAARAAVAAHAATLNHLLLGYDPSAVAGPNSVMPGHVFLQEQQQMADVQSHRLSQLDTESSEEPEEWFSATHSPSPQELSGHQSRSSSSSSAGRWRPPTPYTIGDVIDSSSQRGSAAGSNAANAGHIGWIDSRQSDRPSDARSAFGVSSSVAADVGSSRVADISSDADESEDSDSMPGLIEAGYETWGAGLLSNAAWFNGGAADSGAGFNFAQNPAENSGPAGIAGVWGADAASLSAGYAVEPAAAPSGTAAGAAAAAAWGLASGTFVPGGMPPPAHAAAAAWDTAGPMLVPVSEAAAAAAWGMNAQQQQQQQQAAHMSQEVTAWGYLQPPPQQQQWQQPAGEAYLQEAPVPPMGWEAGQSYWSMVQQQQQQQQAQLGPIDELQPVAWVQRAGAAALDPEASGPAPAAAAAAAVQGPAAVPADAAANGSDAGLMRRLYARQQQHRQQQQVWQAQLSRRRSAAAAAWRTAELSRLAEEAAAYAAIGAAAEDDAASTAAANSSDNQGWQNPPELPQLARVRTAAAAGPARSGAVLDDSPNAQFLRWMQQSLGRQQNTTAMMEFLSQVAGPVAAEDTSAGAASSAAAAAAAAVPESVLNGSASSNPTAAGAPYRPLQSGSGPAAAAAAANSGGDAAAAALPEQALLQQLLDSATRSTQEVDAHAMAAMAGSWQERQQQQHVQVSNDQPASPADPDAMRSSIESDDWQDGMPPLLDAVADLENEGITPTLSPRFAAHQHPNPRVNPDPTSHLNPNSSRIMLTPVNPISPINPDASPMVNPSTGVRQGVTVNPGFGDTRNARGFGWAGHGQGLGPGGLVRDEGLDMHRRLNQLPLIPYTTGSQIWGSGGYTVVGSEGLAAGQVLMASPAAAAAAAAGSMAAAPAGREGLLLQQQQQLRVQVPPPAAMRGRWSSSGSSVSSPLLSPALLLPAAAPAAAAATAAQTPHASGIAAYDFVTPQGAIMMPQQQPPQLRPPQQQQQQQWPPSPPWIVNAGGGFTPMQGGVYGGYGNASPAAAAAAGVHLVGASPHAPLYTAAGPGGWQQQQQGVAAAAAEADHNRSSRVSAGRQRMQLMMQSLMASRNTAAAAAGPPAAAAQQQRLLHQQQRQLQRDLSARLNASHAGTRHPAANSAAATSTAAAAAARQRPGELQQQLLLASGRAWERVMEQRRAVDAAVGDQRRAFGMNAHLGTAHPEVMMRMMRLMGLEDPLEFEFARMFGGGDGLSYEALIGLEDVRVVVPDHVLSALPRRTVPPPEKLATAAGTSEAEAEAVICTICQCDLAGSELVVQLPCKHDYHETCICEWLSKYKKTCPVCKAEVK